MICRVDWRTDNFPVALRYGSDVVHFFHLRIVLAGTGKNNPEMEKVHNVGPIPQGDWKIVGPPVNTTDHGPYVLTLKPAPDTLTFGRGGFLLHGDSKESPGCASHGCVILPLAIREQVWKSGDPDLEVVAEIATPLPAEGER